jgi:parvulin-like peptidyl-prolyl isomerase
MNSKPAIALLGAVLAVACENEPAPSAAAPTTPSAAPALAPSSAPPAATPEAPAAEAKPPEAIAAQHILIAYRGAKNAPKDVKRSKADAKKLADEIVGKARAEGADFSALVQQHSEDPGSKERMGSLGKFKPEAMVKPFSDAAFALKVNAVSDAVETPFGFHVIKRNQ